MVKLLFVQGLALVPEERGLRAGALRGLFGEKQRKGKCYTDGENGKRKKLGGGRGARREILRGLEMEGRGDARDFDAAGFDGGGKCVGGSGNGPKTGHADGAGVRLGVGQAAFGIEVRLREKERSEEHKDKDRGTPGSHNTHILRRRVTEMGCRGQPKEKIGFREEARDRGDKRAGGLIRRAGMLLEWRRSGTSKQVRERKSFEPMMNL
jgi:hypothetical protein